MTVAVLTGFLIHKSRIAHQQEMTLNQGREAAAQLVVRFVDQLDQGQYQSAFKLLQLIEMTKVDSVLHLDRTTTLRSRRELAIALLEEIYGDNTTQDRRVQQQLDAALASMNELSSSHEGVGNARQ